MGRRISAHSNARYRLGYFVISSFIVTLTFLVPDTYLWGSDNCILRSRIVVAAMFILSVASFLILQGSNPGYIDLDTESSNHYDNDEYLEYPHDYADTDSFLDSNTINSDLAVVKGQGDVEGNNTKSSAKMLTPVQVPKKRCSESLISEYRPGGPSGLVAVPNRKNADAIEPSLKGPNKFIERAKDKIRKNDRRSHVACDLIEESKSHNTPHDGDNINRINFHDKESYCKYCAIAVPLRSHHCNHCQRCVATFDHHCFVIGTCIGERNHCRFFTFLLINFLGVWYLSTIVDSAFGKYAQSVKNQSTDVTDTGSRYDRRPPNHMEVAYILSAFLGILWWYAFFLIVYQTWLVATSSTGYECIKSNNANNGEDFETCDSPYGGKTVCHNFFTFCCLRDGLLSYFKGVPWRHVVWKKPLPRPNQEDVRLFDNFCRNRHYSCC